VSYLNALFTATSATCVTGLVVVDTGTRYSLFGQIVILFLLQIGGLGYMTMATSLFLLTGRRIYLRERMALQEALGQFGLAGLVRLTIYIIKVTLVIESAGVLVLFIRWLPDFGAAKALYFAIFHSVSAFCNAGFDLLGGTFGKFGSLTPYAEDVTISLTVAILVIIGGIGFTVISDVYTARRFSRLPVISDVHTARRFPRLSFHSKVVITITAVLLLLGTIVIFGLEYSNPNTLKLLSPKGKILASFFQAMTPRTAGFSTIPIDKMNNATLLFINILMFIGASPGGTGGGIKTTTFVIIVMAVWATMHGDEDANIFRRKLSKAVVYKAITVAFLSLSLVIIATTLLCISEEKGFLPILFEITSAFGTVGLSTGITSHTSSFARVIIMSVVFAGRLGPLTIATAITLRQSKLAKVEYPEDNIMIG